MFSPIFSALKFSAGDEPQVQVSLPTLAGLSSVPKGSVHPVLRRLADAGRIEIIVPEHTGGTRQPNIYRFTEATPAAAPEAEPPEPDAAAPEEAAAEPVAAEVEAPEIAKVWEAPGRRVAPKTTPVKFTDASSIRDRIVKALKGRASTTSGLATMLDLKELAVCQTLDAMKHDGLVSTDEMPEAGRRAQLWRLAQEAAA